MQGFTLDETIISSDGYWTETQHIGVGIPVLSRCEKTGALAEKRVTRVFTHDAEERIPLVSVKIRRPSLPKIGNWVVPQHFCGVGLHQIHATPEQPFWVKGVGWVEAGQLQPGQQLEVIDPLAVDDVSRPDGYKIKDMVATGQLWPIEVISVEPVNSIYGGALLVYNFEVEDFHTYFVTGFGVWVQSVR